MVYLCFWEKKTSYFKSFRFNVYPFTLIIIDAVNRMEMANVGHLSVVDCSNKPLSMFPLKDGTDALLTLSHILRREHY